MRRITVWFNEVCSDWPCFKRETNWTSFLLRNIIAGNSIHIVPIIFWAVTFAFCCAFGNLSRISFYLSPFVHDSTFDIVPNCIPFGMILESQNFARKYSKSYTKS